MRRYGRGLCKGFGRGGGARRGRGGFTLLETALAMVIVLVGVLAIMEAQGAFIRSNNWSSHEATATYLGAEIREMIRALPKHDPVTGLTVTESGGSAEVQGIGPEAGETTVQDFDDVDDFADAVFGQAGTFDGPVSASGAIIPEINPATGQVVLDGFGNPLPMRGWIQQVIVEKVDPFDFSIVRDWAYYEPPSGGFAGRAVDEYPLRVTVIVLYQPTPGAEPEEVTRMSWIMP